jgi:hypothetical protein
MLIPGCRIHGLEVLWRDTVAGSVMTELAVITPSYAPDVELCSDLNASVLRHTSDSVVHYIITPRRDVELFSGLRGPRTELLAVDELLPRRMLPVPWANFWVNFRHPIPPIRGWVMQQLVKLQAAVRIEADQLLLVDSDVLFVRPVTADTFVRGGRIRFYRKEAGVDESLPRHLIWHNVARMLLGLPPAGRPPLPDYVSAFNVWDRTTVLAMQERIQSATGRNWLDAVAAQMHFSEFILYGVFVDNVLDGRAEVDPSASMLCHSYWDPAPLSATEAKDFVRRMPAEDVAIMISAKSRTPLDLRRSALAEMR